METLICTLFVSCVLCYLIPLFICLIPAYISWRKDEERVGNTMRDFLEDLDYSDLLIIFAFIPVINMVCAVVVTLFGCWHIVFIKILGDVKIAPDNNK